MRYTINRGNTAVATVRPTGKLQTEIMGQEVVPMDFELSKKVSFLTNDTVVVYGNTYYLGNEPVVRKVNERKYQYSLQFVGVKYELSKVQYFYPDHQNVLKVSEWTAIADANTFINLVVQNANRVQSGWTKGNVEATEAIQLDFNEDNCLSALAKIAEAFKLEYWVDGDKSIHFQERKSYSGYSFSYGKAKGLRGLTRTPLDNSNIVTRLYASGGDKNLPKNYRNSAKNLQMPVAHLEKNTAKYGIIELTKNFPEIFPKRLGTVTAVDANNPLVFTDSTIDFDLNETDSNGTVILIPNLSAKIKFNSGQLAGYTFEIRKNGYQTATKTITLLTNTDETDIEVPSNLLRPAVGDKYVLFDVRMPQSYVTNAEQELQATAQQYLDKNCEQRLQYKMEADPLYFKVQNIQIRLGNTVKAIDAAFNLNDYLRVVSLSIDLQNAYDVDFEVSETVAISSIVRGYIESEKQQATTKRIQAYNSAMAKRSYNFAKEIQDNVFDGEGYFDPKKIKPLSIETKMLTVGSRMQQLNLENVLLTVTNNNTAVTNTAGTLVHLNIEDQPRNWNISANTQINIGAGFHYIYAKAERAGSQAVILVSPNQIAVEADATYYHFEIGYLGSIENGFRRIKTTYGFTQVSPGEITTGRISSANGEQYIDLKQNGIDIVANVTFTANSPAIQQIKDKVQTPRNYVLKSDVTSTTNKSFNFSFENDVNVIRNKTIVLSIDVDIRGGNSYDFIQFFIGVTYNSGGTQFLDLKKSGSFRGRFYKEFTIQDKLVTGITYKNVYVSNNGTAYKVQFSRPALHIGAGEKPWSPAPEDVYLLINDAKNFSSVASVNQYAEVLKNQQAELYKLYQRIYGDTTLTSTLKNNLSQKWNIYNSAYSQTIGAINSYVADNKITTSEESNLQTQFSNYRNQLVALRDAMETSTKYVRSQAISKANTAQNTANTANAKAQTARTEAQNAQTTADRLNQKTDFLSETKINGNTTATGTLQVGNSQGANAGVTGVGVGNSVRFYAGSDFANRNTAPFRVTDNGEFHAKKGTIGGIKINENSLGSSHADFQGAQMVGDFMYLDDNKLVFERTRRYLISTTSGQSTWRHETKKTTVNADGVTTTTESQILQY